MHLLRTIAALALSALLWACPADDARAPVDAKPAKPKRVMSTDQVINVVLPTDLLVHRFAGSVQGVSGDGSYRLHVERLASERLIRLAAASKDGWSARGWEVTGEQHFEHALFAALKRGGTKRKPLERREVWWIERDGAVALCDVIAAPPAFERLGEPVRAGCQTIEVVSWPTEE